jgi:hypothetical protein
MNSNNSYEYHDLVRQIVFSLIDKAAYLKGMDASLSSYDESYFQGQVFAHHQVLDCVFDLLRVNGFPPEIFGVEDFNPMEVLRYRPLGSAVQPLTS